MDKQYPPLCSLRSSQSILLKCSHTQEDFFFPPSFEGLGLGGFAKWPILKGVGIGLILGLSVVDFVLSPILDIYQEKKKDKVKLIFLKK